MPGRDPVLLLVHGLGGSARTWERALPLIAARWRASTVELPGFGARAGEPAADSVEAMAEVLEPAARAAASGDPVVVVGHSMGGDVAVALAELGQVPLAGVVAVDAPLSVAGRAVASRGSEALIRNPVVGPIAWRLASRRALRRGLASAVAPGAEVPEAFVDDLARCSWRAFAGSTAAVDRWLQATPLADRLARLSVPAAYVVGSADRRITPAALAEFRARGTVPIFDVADAGHTPMWEQPEAFTAALEQAIVALHSVAVPPNHR